MALKKPLVLGPGSVNNCVNDYLYNTIKMVRIQSFLGSEKMKKTILLIMVLVIAAACQPTKKLRFRWNKNIETSLSHYDLFFVVLPDSNDFYTLTDWPVDMDQKVWLDTLTHFPFLLSTMGHIYSPIDSMAFEWNQTMSRGYGRGYIMVTDSLGNLSPFSPSISIINIGKRDLGQVNGDIKEID